MKDVNRSMKTGFFKYFWAAALTPLALLLALTVQRTAAQTSRSSQSPSTISGTWESGGQDRGPWIFNLQANGATLTGQLWQDGGQTGPIDIVDGRITGGSLSFKYRLPPENPRGLLNAPGPPIDRTVTLSGTIQAGQIAFVSKVDPPPSNQGPRFPGVVAARQQRDEGLFSAFVRERFTVKRGVAAFPGRVTVEDGAPCPVFRLIFVNSNGKRLEAIRRDLRPTVIARPVPTMRQFLARLPAGKYRVEVADLPKGFVAASIQAAGADILRTGLEVPADGIPTALTVTIGITGGPPWTALQGRVVNTATRKGQMRSGNVSVAPRLLPPTGLQLTSSAFFEPWLLDLGPNGSFEFPRIPAGQYQVHVLPDTVNTPALKLQIPAAGLVNLEIAAPDVVPIGCGNC